LQQNVTSSQVQFDQDVKKVNGDWIFEKAVCLTVFHPSSCISHFFFRMPVEYISVAGRKHIDVAHVACPTQGAA
jgi:hypothetical protein